MYELVFINEKGKRVALKFDSYYQYEKMLNKLKHSKTCTLVSWQ